MLKSIGLVLFFAVGSLGFCRASDPDLMAHYTFKDGAGNILRDRSGHGNDGVVHGARFVAVGNAGALDFNGKTDEVEIPSSKSLDITGQVTLAAWVNPVAPPAFGETTLVGKHYDSYTLNYFIDGKVRLYINAPNPHVKAQLKTGVWQHVVGTFDGKTAKIYVNGKLIDQGVRNTVINSTREFVMGKNIGNPKYSHAAPYRGMLGETKVLRRAWTPAEVSNEYHTTHATQMVDSGSHIYPHNREITVDLDWRGLGQFNADTDLEVSLWRPGSNIALYSTQISKINSWSNRQVLLKVPALIPGLYNLRALARNRNGSHIGIPRIESIQWPSLGKVPASRPGYKVLNNLVIELLNAQNIKAKSSLNFTMPRDGFVYIVSRGNVRKNGRISLALQPTAPGRSPVIVHTVSGAQEAMRRLKRGSYKIVADGNGQGILDSLIVRSVPELGFDKFGVVPNVTPYGPFDWKYVKQHIAPHCNVLIAQDIANEPAALRDWKEAGKSWIVRSKLPGIDETPVTIEEVLKAWTASPGYKIPGTDGIVVDEFKPGEKPNLKVWAAAIRRLNRSPQYANKSFNVYCAPLYSGVASRDLAEAVMEGNGRLVFERYLWEQPSEGETRRAIESFLAEPTREWQKAQPKLMSHLVMLPAYFSAPFQMVNVNPRADFKVFMDMQFQALATDPTFFGLRGIQWYCSNFSEDESLRWGARLYRHYAIEGKTNLLSEEYGYKFDLKHLRNATFTQGLNHWQVEAADNNSVQKRHMPNLSFLEGSYPQGTAEGDNLVWMKRSSSKPNRISQVVTDLKPGRLYSVKLFVGDYADLSTAKSRQGRHAYSIKLDNADVVPAKSFKFEIPNVFVNVANGFDAKNKAWFNFNHIVFRAKGKTARLTISDWLTPKQQGGPEGQELLFNFIELQPYFG